MWTTTGVALHRLSDFFFVEIEIENSLKLIDVFFIFFLQRPDSDEKFRRIQSDKEALALQVQVLSEQVSLQNEKIVEMERLINEKNRLISNAEDLLQRVSKVFYFKLLKIQFFNR